MVLTELYSLTVVRVLQHDLRQLFARCWSTFRRRGQHEQTQTPPVGLALSLSVHQCARVIAGGSRAHDNILLQHIEPLPRHLSARWWWKDTWRRLNDKPNHDYACPTMTMSLLRHSRKMRVTGSSAGRDAHLEEGRKWCAVVDRSRQELQRPQLGRRWLDDRVYTVILLSVHICRC